MVLAIAQLKSTPGMLTAQALEFVKGPVRFWKDIVIKTLKRHVKLTFVTGDAFFPRLRGAGARSVAAPQMMAGMP